MAVATAEVLHAGCVALPVPGGARGVLILGPSGAGKSALALQLLALGAVLVADDRCAVARRGDRLVAQAPAAIRGLIEARGVGLLRAPTLPEAELALAVDLGQAETQRLPPERELTVLGVPLACLHAVAAGHFPAAILLYLQQGRGDA